MCRVRRSRLPALTGSGAMVVMLAKPLLDGDDEVRLRRDYELGSKEGGSEMCGTVIGNSIAMTLALSKDFSV